MGYLFIVTVAATENVRHTRKPCMKLTVTTVYKKFVLGLDRSPHLSDVQFKRIFISYYFLFVLIYVRGLVMAYQCVVYCVCVRIVSFPP